MSNRPRRPQGGQNISLEHPVYSRLFVVYDKKVSEQDLRDAFSEHGEIEDLKIPYNDDGVAKGICFIKFSKTSEAARAMEALHMKYIAGSQRPLKIAVAINNRSDVESEEKYKRLFVQVPRNITEKELEAQFSPYGNVTSLQIQYDKITGEPREFAYITFSKFSEAANAFENCNKQYRAIFAKPRLQSDTPNVNLFPQADNRSSLIPMMGSCSRGFTRVHFKCSSYIGEFLIERLFDLIPGLVKVDYFPPRSYENFIYGVASYSNPTSAGYAVDKLNDFEFPPGMKIFVKPDESSYEHDGRQFGCSAKDAITNLKNALLSANNSGTPDLAQLSMVVAEAQKVINAATGVSLNNIPDTTDIKYCSVKLPPPKPLAHIDSKLGKRCFLVCKPAPPPLTVLRDIFCRFGDLIDIYTLPNKTVGFARYASVSAADEAIKVLHGAEICGVRMKVLDAEDEDNPNKRRRT